MWVGQLIEQSGVAKDGTQEKGELRLKIHSAIGVKMIFLLEIQD
jgi:hypothetical protein